MKIETITKAGTTIALVSAEEKLIYDVQSALELLMSVRYESGAAGLVVSKDAVAEPFFILSTGLAGEILQKFINYRMKLAIYGDYSGYTSKPLHDFIYESNQGKNIFFVGSREEGVRRLLEAVS